MKLRAIRLLAGCVACIASLLGSPPGHADNSFQLLPEANVFLKVNERCPYQKPRSD